MIKEIAKLLFVLLIVGCFFYTHEYLHKTLFKYDGIDSKIGICSKGLCTTANVAWNEISPEVKNAQFMADVMFYTLLLPFIVLVLLLIK
jgi:hypothetical protein